MTGNEVREHEEYKESINPNILFLIIPSIAIIAGSILLYWFTVYKSMFWNYLAGAHSPIDQAVLALFGPDISRQILLVSALTSIIVGGILSYFLLTVFDTLRQEKEASLGVMRFLGLIVWTPAMLLLQVEVDFIFGSVFLEDLALFFIAGFYLGAGIIIVLMYIQLLRFADENWLQVKLFESKKQNKVTLRLVTNE